MRVEIKEWRILISTTFWWAPRSPKIAVLSTEGTEGGGRVTIVYRTVFFCQTKVVLRTFITLLCLAFVFLLKMSSCVKQKWVVDWWSGHDANKWAIRLGVVQFRGNNRKNRCGPNYLVTTHWFDESLSKQYGITLLYGFPYISEERLKEKICVKYPASGRIYGMDFSLENPLTIHSFPL